MKKQLVTLCLILAACFSKATIYYQPYPLTVTQTTNGTDFRLECTVYDSSLASIQTYNTAYYEIIDMYTNLNGVLVFAGGNSATNDGDAGCVTYDFEVHQWKAYTKYQNTTDTRWGNILTGGFVRLGFYFDQGGDSEEYTGVGYYDIVNHNWIMHEENANGNNNTFALVTQNVLQYGTGMGDIEPEYYTYSPAAHNWNYLFTVGVNYTDFIDDGLVGAFSDIDNFGIFIPGFEVATLDAQTGIQGLDYSFYDVTDYSVNSGIFCQRNALNSEVVYGKYDAQQHLWKTNTFPSADIVSWKTGGGIISFVNSASSLVVNAVYDFNQHQWVYDSVPTPSVSGHAVSNGTVTWNNGSGTVTRGYNAIGGWSNSATAPQAVFHLSNLSSLNAGNLVYVRNYSLGATGWSYDFGDGIVSGEKNLFHLYKVGGSYLYSGSSPSANICLTVTSPLGNNSSCQSIGCTPPTASITAGGPISFCTGDSVTLNVGTAAGYTYQWQLNTADITGETNSSYVANAAGSYTCVVTNACGTVTSNAISVTINAGPAAAITAGGATTFCPGGNVTLNVGTAVGYSYQWQLNTSDISGETNSSYVANAAGSYTCVVTNTCGTATSNAISVAVNATPTAAISAGGPTTFCSGGNVLLSANAGAGLSYQWKLNGSPIGGETLISYSATSAGNYTCDVTNTCSTLTSNAIAVTVNTGSVAAINNLSGATYMCPGNSYNYSVTNNNGATFNWTVPANVTITSGQGTNAITLSVNTGFTAGSICVNATNGCATSLTKCNGVATTVPGRPTSISGVLNGVCASTKSYTSSSVSGATGYTWSVTGGNILSGQGTLAISVQWNGTGTTGVLNVAASNGCGTGLVRSVGTTLKPDVASAISGSHTLCAGSTNNIFTIPAATGASTYTWQITPGGSTIVSGQGTTSINSTWGSSSGTVLCTPYNACGSSKTKQFAVTVNCRVGNDDVESNGSGLMELDAYPNPFNDKINITLNSNDDASVSIKVSDVTGRIISEQRINANSIYSLGENMSDGIYFITAKQNDIIKTIRIVKNQ